MRQPILSLQNLTRAYDDFLALDCLTFDIAQGQIFGFLGHNGAGKTTTLHLLTTLAQPTSGTATVAGFDIVKQPQDVRRNIGYVPENLRLYDTLTTRENLLFFARLSGIDTPQSAVEETLDILQCRDLIDRRVGTFSKGMRQRVGLAQAILHRPKVLFLDEPTSGLDPAGVKLLRDLITRLNRDLGMTVFMNTHLISEVAKTCTSIGVLSHGRLVYHDTMAAVTRRFGNESSLEELYLSVTPLQAVPT